MTFSVKYQMNASRLYLYENEHIAKRSYWLTKLFYHALSTEVTVNICTHIFKIKVLLLL